MLAVAAVSPNMITSAGLSAVRSPLRAVPMAFGHDSVATSLTEKADKADLASVTKDDLKNPKYSVIQKALLWPIRQYQLLHLRKKPNGEVYSCYGNRCLFHPSCSQNMANMIKEHGSLKGLWLGTVQIAKCNPFYPAVKTLGFGEGMMMCAKKAINAVATPFGGKPFQAEADAIDTMYTEWRANNRNHGSNRA